MQNKLFLKAADICELLEVKQTSAYEIIGNLNKELEEQVLSELAYEVGERYFAIQRTEKQASLSAIALLAYSYFLFLLSILGMKKDAHLLNVFN